MLISEQAGNPANGLRQEYGRLMSIKDASTLHAEASKLVEAYRGKGISERNFMKFRYTINGLKDSLLRMQGFLSNFILKADGDGVL